MSTEQSVKVNLGERSYQIKIGWEILSRAGEEMKAVISPRKAVIVSNYVVAPLLAERLKESLEKSGLQVCETIIPDGEDYKSLDTARDLYRQFLEHGIDRHDVVVALGGGVIGDLAGFVAATYMRGVPLVQLPTTLLAQVDSSIGGKTAVNLPEGKNLVGSFYQPGLVLSDPLVLRTLPQREFRAGLAEMIKTAFLMGDSFLIYLENHIEEILAHKPVVLVEAITRCVRHKAGIVEVDEKDLTDERAVLNYGHTIGHALEALTRFKQLLHGEAIAIGMLCAVLISYELGLCRKELLERHYALVTKAGLPVQPPKVGIEQLVDQLTRDKKKDGDQLLFVLLKEEGQPVVTEVTVEMVRKVFSRLVP